MKWPCRSRLFPRGLIALLLITAVACSPTTPPSPAAQKTDAKPTSPPAATSAPAAKQEKPAAKEADKPAAAEAADYPRQPITLIVPWAAGGDTDVPMRVVAEFVSRELGQPIVVQNVVGASGTVGTRQARGARADGYTLLSIHEHMIINQGTGVVDYGVEDFDPIALVVTSPVYLATEASNPWNNLKDLIEDAKQRPEQITWGATFGSTSHMFGAAFTHKTDTTFRFVGYEGTAQRMTALLGKQIDLGQTPLSTTVEQMKAGKIKVLGYAWDQRDPRTPDVPTFKEQGVDLEWGESRGWVAPKGTPEPIVQKVQDAIRRAVENPELKMKIEEEQGSLLTFLPGQEYKARLAQQDQELKKVIAETGMKSS